MKNLEMVLDFMINVKSDKNQLNQFANETEKILKKMSPEIKFDKEQFKKEIQNLQGLFSNLTKDAGSLENALKQIELDLNSDEAIKSFDELVKLAKELNGIDLTQFEKAFESLSDDELIKITDALNTIITDFDTTKAQKEIDKMASSLGESEAEIKKFIQSKYVLLGQLKQTGKEGTEAYKKTKQEIKKAQEELKKFGKTTDDTGKKTKTFSDRMATFGLASQGLRQLTDTVTQLAQPFVKLDSATNQIKTLGGAAKENAEVFRQMNVEMAKEYPIGAEALQAASYNALSAGIKATEKDLKTFMTTANKLAVGGNETIDNSVDLLSSLVNAYGEAASATGKYSDAIFTTVNLGKTTIPELGASMANILPTAAAYGNTIENVGASLALMTANGIPTAQATTKLNQLMIEMQKPGSELASILENAGFSAETLAKKVGSGDFIGALKDMDTAFKQAGKTATQAFSSSDSGAAFNVLAKDFNKLEENLSAFANSAGTTEAAYQDMSQSIENKTKQMQASMDAFFINAIDSMGSVGPAFVTLSNSLGAIAPQLTALQGLGSIIPEDLGDNIMNLSSKFGKNLAGSLGIATTSMKAFTMSIITNPVILSAAAIATLVVSLRALSDSMHETAEEKLNYAKAESELIDQQIEVAKQQAESVKSNQELIIAFEQQGEAAMKNQSLMKKLASAYPGVIDMTKSYSENLKELYKESNITGLKLNDLDKTITELSNKKIELSIQTFRLEANKVKEDMENVLTDALIDDKTWLNPLGKAGIYISEFLFGTSETRSSAEKQMKAYTDEIYKAANSDEIRQASLKLQMAILNGEGEFSKLDPNQKNALAQQAEEMANFEIQQREAVANRTKLLIEEQLKNGRKEIDVINDVVKNQGKSRKEVESIVKSLKEELTIQKEKNKELDEEEKRRKLLGTLISDKIKKAQEDFNVGLDEEATLLTRIAEAKKAGRSVSEIEEELRLVRQKNEGYNKEINQIEKTQQAVKSRYEPKTVRPWLDVVKEEIALQERVLTNAVKLEELDIKRNALLSGRNINENDNFLIAQKNLELQEKLRNEWIKQLEVQGKIIKDSNTELGFRFSGSISKANQKEIEEVLMQRKIEIENSELTLLQYKFDTDSFSKEIDSALQELNESQFVERLQNNLVSEIDFNNVLQKLRSQKSAIELAVKETNNKIVDLEKEKQDELAKLGENASQRDILNINIQYQNRINAEKQNFQKLTDNLINNQNKLNQYSQSFYKNQLSDLTKQIDNEIALVNQKYDELNSQLSANNVNWLNAEKNAMDKMQSDSLNSLEFEKAKRLKELDELGKLQVRSTETIEKQKADIEAKFFQDRENAINEFNKFRITQEAMIKGIEIETQRQKTFELAELEQRRLQIEIDSINKRKEAGELLNVEDILKLNELESKYQDVTKMIEFNTDEWTSILHIAGNNMSDAITNIFAGNTKEAIDSFRELFGSILGIFANYLQKYIEGVVGKLVLDWLYVTAGTPIEKLLLTPLISTMIGSTVKAFTNPIISQLLSFSTGGRVDQPTYAVIGDGSRLGSANREWIFNDPQLISIVQMSSLASNSMIVSKLDEVVNVLRLQELKAKLKGNDINLSVKRSQYNDSARSR